jgi:hypothetical protein
MIAQTRTLNEISGEAIRVLVQHMGVADTIRFINQFSMGEGNYTEERDSLFGHLTLDEILAELPRHDTDPAS